MKKGQVTIFIIIGVILLFSSAIVIYLKDTIQSKEIETLNPQITEVPKFAEPVNNFISNCIKQTAKRAFIEIGNTGGYTDTSHLAITQDPTTSDAIEFLKGTGITPAYWHYLKGDNNCKGFCSFESKIPPLHKNDETSFVKREFAIENQLEKYISTNLNECLNNFISFDKQGVNVKSKIPNATVQITEKDVRFLVEMPTEITKDSKKTTINKFFEIINIDFNSIYNLAAEVTRAEQKYGFIERVTLDLLNVFSGIDKLKIPPMSGSDIGSSSIFWQSESVKENIQLMLQTYIRYLKVQSSINFERIILQDKSPTAQSVFDSMVIPLQGFDKVGVTFDYFANWPLYFTINSKGGLIQPESIYEPIFNFGIHRYNAVYDLSFPVMVTVADPFAFNNEGYAFRFGLEANIRNNDVLNSSFDEIEAVNIPQGTLFCELNQRNSGNVSVKIINAINSSPIKDVRVYYTIGKESCLIGNTDNSGQLVEKFPVGFNGIVTFEKEDYIGISDIYTTTLHLRDNYGTISLLPLHDMKFNVMKKKVLPRWTFENIEYELEENETAVVTMTRKGKIGEKRHEIIFTTDEPFTGKVAPGDYHIDINVINNKNLTILPKKQCFSTLPFGLGKKCSTVPETPLTLDTIQSGGFNGEVTILPSNVYQKSQITLYAINPDIYSIAVAERTVDDLEQINNIDSYSQVYKNQLQPWFK